MTYFSRILLHRSPGSASSLYRSAFGLFRGPVVSTRYAHERSKVNIKIVPPDAQKEALNRLGYEDRNERMGRVLSPHLTIYAPQMTSMLSISQRISGMALTMYVWGLGIGSLLASCDMQHYITMIEGLELNETLLAVGKFLFVLPFTFHYFNSFRHLMWSFGNMLKLNLVYSTGYMVLALTPLSALGLSFL